MPSQRPQTKPAPRSVWPISVTRTRRRGRKLVEALGDNAKALDALQSGEANVLGGTAWLWARPEFAESVDVLFVDEAGQMSLANVLAVSQAAESIVLLGDPQQLDQPQKGSSSGRRERVSAAAHAGRPPDDAARPRHLPSRHVAPCSQYLFVHFRGVLREPTPLQSRGSSVSAWSVRATSMAAGSGSSLSTTTATVTRRWRKSRSSRAWSSVSPLVVHAGWTRTATKSP